MRVLCLIPARGGSKGIPRKNLTLIGGKPLIGWTIEQVLADISHMPPGVEVDVVVSTEDPEIAEMSRSHGAEVPFLRPAALAEDTTATEPVVLHAITEMRSLGRGPDAVMLLQATSPVRRRGTIARAVREFLNSRADSLVGVVPQAPFLWRLPESETSAPLPDYDVDNRKRRQDFTPRELRYRETGSLYVTRADIYETRCNRLGPQVALFVMDEVEGVDVDTRLDLAVAERKLAELEG